MPTVEDLRKLEKDHARQLKAADRKRSKDKREAYLTADILRNRQYLTKNGRKRLVLDYGAAGKKEFSLQQLSEMAAKIEKRAGKFESNVNGVPVPDLLRASLPIDKQRAKTIRNAALFKFAGETLFFRVTASGETIGAPSHYLVRVRLDDWQGSVRKGIGDNYLPAATEAVRGHVSFDCNCGRHQFWYRYLATIGGFALSPEHVFPKIRNPRLTGACCKHTLKTLLVLQSPVIQGRVASEMAAEAKKKGFGLSRAKTLKPEHVAEMEETGNVNFTDYALKAFRRKLKEPATLQAQSEYRERNRPAMEKKNEENAQLRKKVELLSQDVLLGNMARYFISVGVYAGKISKDQAIADFAAKHQMPLNEVKKFAENI
jgi:ribosomal protein S21